MGLGLGLGNGIDSVSGASKPNGNPSALTLTVLSDTSIKCDWTNGATNQDGTYVYISTDNVNFTNNATALGSLTTKTLIGLTENTTYYIKVVHYKGSKLSEYSSVVSISTFLTPTAGWYDSVSIVNSSGKASQITDKTANARNLIQVDVNLQPSITDNSLNGYPTLVYDGTNDRNLLNTFTLNQPFTVVAVGTLNSFDTDGSLFGSVGSPYVAAIWDCATQTHGAFAGQTTFKFPQLNQNIGIPKIFESVINGASSKMNMTGISGITGDAGANTMKGFQIGGYANADGATAPYNFYEILVYSKALDDSELLNVRNYLNNKYRIIFSSTYDGIFKDSVEYTDKTTYKIRSAHSIYKFITTDTLIKVKAKSTIYGNFPDYSYLSIFINGIYNQRVQYNASDTYKDIILPSGVKTVEIVEPLTTRINDAGDVLGVFVQDVKTYSSYTKPSISDVSEKILFLGDSITVGGNSTNPSSEAFSTLFRVENNKDVGILGYGYAKIASFMRDVSNINATIAWIDTMFSNVTTTKKLVIALGTNDYDLDGTSAATIKTYLENFIDALHTHDSSIKVYCISPIMRGDAKEDSILDQYRTNIGDVCTARSSYCTYINGKAILTYPTGYGDLIHPNTAGHKAYKDYIYPIVIA